MAKFDPSKFIMTEVSRIGRMIADAQESKIKDLLEAAYNAGWNGCSNAFDGIDGQDFEQWFADLQERIRNDGV